jgi:hypothetical protein
MQHWVWVALPDVEDPALGEKPVWTCDVGTRNGDAAVLYRATDFKDFAYVFKVRSEPRYNADLKRDFGSDYACDADVVAGSRPHHASAGARRAALGELDSPSAQLPRQRVPNLAFRMEGARRPRVATRQTALESRQRVSRLRCVPRNGGGPAGPGRRHAYTVSLIQSSVTLAY